MSVITLVGAAFSNKSDVIKEVSATSGYRTVDVNEIMALAGKSSGMSEAKIMAAFSAKTSVFNRFTHEKERSVAHLRLALAELLRADGTWSFSGPLALKGRFKRLLPAANKMDLCPTLMQRGAIDAASLPYSYAHESYKIHELVDTGTMNRSGDPLTR